MSFPQSSLSSFFSSLLTKRFIRPPFTTSFLLITHFFLIIFDGLDDTNFFFHLLPPPLDFPFQWTTWERPPFSPLSSVNTFAHARMFRFLETIPLSCSFPLNPPLPRPPFLDVYSVDLYSKCVLPRKSNPCPNHQAPLFSPECSTVSVLFSFLRGFLFSSFFFEVSAPDFMIFCPTSVQPTRISGLDFRLVMRHRDLISFLLGLHVFSLS